MEKWLKRYSDLQSNGLRKTSRLQWSRAMNWFRKRYEKIANGTWIYYNKMWVYFFIQDEMKFLFFDELNQEGLICWKSVSAWYGRILWCGLRKRHTWFKALPDETEDIYFRKPILHAFIKKQGLQLMRLIPDIEQQKRRVMICD